MTTNKEKLIDITSEDLPLSCPMPEYDDWDAHPRVFLTVESKQTICPYCGTLYQMNDFDD